MATKKSEYDMLKDEIDEATLDSEILGDMVNERLYRVFGSPTMEAFHDAEVSEDMEARIQDAESKFTSIVLARIFKTLYSEHLEVAQR